MLSESGGVATQIHKNNVYPNKQVTPDWPTAEKQTENPHSGVFDKVSLSAEALALARRSVVIAGRTVQDHAGGPVKGHGEEPSGPPRLLDLRI